MIFLELVLLNLIINAIVTGIGQWILNRHFDNIDRMWKGEK